MKQLLSLATLAAALALLAPHTAQAAPKACDAKWLNSPGELLKNLKSSVDASEEERSCTLSEKVALDFGGANGNAKGEGLASFTSSPPGDVFKPNKGNFRKLEINAKELKQENGAKIRVTPSGEAGPWALLLIRIHKPQDKVLLTLEPRAQFCDDAWLAKPDELLTHVRRESDAPAAQNCLLKPNQTLDIAAIGATQFAKLEAADTTGLAFPAGQSKAKFNKITFGSDLPDSSDLTLKLDPPADDKSAWHGLALNMVKQGDEVRLSFVRDDAAVASAPTPDGSKKANELPACSNSAFEPVPGSIDDIEMKKACADHLCITPSGKIYGISEPATSLGSLDVELWVPSSNTLSYSLDIDYKKLVVKGDNFANTGTEKKAAASERRFAPAAPPQRVKLTAAGKLVISVSWKGGGKGTSVVYNATQQACTPSETGKMDRTLTVTGKYYFMLGIMPTYAGLYDREHSLNRSDDGVQRVFQQDVREIDYAATLSAYPWGVDEDNDRYAVGTLVGTSLRNPGQRWYLGLGLSTPLNIGFVGGAGLIVVNELDHDFEAGQPLADSSFPTHRTVVPTWFLGVNIEAELFKRAFKGIVGDD